MTQKERHRARKAERLAAGQVCGTCKKAEYCAFPQGLKADTPCIYYDLQYERDEMASCDVCGQYATVTVGSFKNPEYKRRVCRAHVDTLKTPAPKPTDTHFRDEHNAD